LCKKNLFLFRLAIIVFLNLCIIGLVSIASGRSVDVLVRQGSTGEQVRQVQSRLKSLGYYTGKVDGIYGSATASAVIRFQRDKGLTADGVAGLQTLTSLGITFSQGSRGDDVKTIQTQLKSLGYYTGAVDGIFGSMTGSAVVTFQRKNNLTADGIVGSATAKMLYSSSATKSGSTGGAYSNSDYYLLARIISAEARGEPYLGQVAVGAVIMNRVDHTSFPDTIAGVIYQPGAFTAITDGQIHAQIVDSSYRAAKEVLNGSDPSGGALYYYNPQKTSNQWMLSRPVIKVIGTHYFCK
jgi:N-acetylmuramoyl-L-alanine amidase